MADNDLSPIERLWLWFDSRPAPLKAVFLMGGITLVGAISLLLGGADPPPQGPEEVDPVRDRPSAERSVVSPSPATSPSEASSGGVERRIEEVPSFLPGISLQPIVDPLAQDGYRCDGPRPTFDSFEWSCVMVDVDIECRVRIEAADPRRVIAIEAIVRGRTDAANLEHAARPLFRSIGKAVFSGRLRRQALGWLSEDLEDGTTTAVGRIRLTASRSGRPAEWRLRLTPS